MTNIVYIIQTNAIPVTVLGWDKQCEMFSSGFSSGIWIALTLAAVAAVVRAVGAPRFPTSND